LFSLLGKTNFFHPNQPLPPQHPIPNTPTHSAFHLGRYERAQEAYTELLSGNYGKPPPEVKLHLAAVYFYMQMYKEAEEIANEYEPESALKNRILFHVCHKLNDEQKLMQYHQKLTDTNEDQLSLAAIHYLRSHFQEATDIYKRLLLENRDDLALNVYVAMCYYKLDYYDVSLEILAVYLQTHPDIAVAINLKACNHFRLYNGKAAETELKVLADHGHILQANDLIRHNMVVFSNGDQALQVLPSLIDFVPEARLNLVIYYLRHDGVQEADALLKDLEPSTPQEYILKGVVNSCMGQSMGTREVSEQNDCITRPKPMLTLHYNYFARRRICATPKLFSSSLERVPASATQFPADSAWPVASSCSSSSRTLTST